MTQTPVIYQQNTHDMPGYNTDRSTHEIKQWCLLIALPVIGMLLLMVCFLLHGIFAVAGPWAIFIGVRLIIRKVEHKEGRYRQSAVHSSK